jgi:hypothetical protein
MTADIAWVGDGAGAMSVPSAQRLKMVIPAPYTQVPGGDAPSTANISAACLTASTALAALFNAQIGQIQGFATGGG